MELLIAGLAAVGAGTISNPFEVIKIRMQLQGELKARGEYAVHYRNVFHATYQIAKKDGILALQKGLSPALWYQFTMNGSRLGTYHMAEKAGFTRDANGKVSPLGTVVCGSISGVIGALVGSPFYLVKTHLQSKADPSIAVGHQHDIKGMSSSLLKIYKDFGIIGLWRGSSSAVPRIAVASSVQLLTFEKANEFVINAGVFKDNRWGRILCSSLFSGVFVAFFMAPFDLMATRFYNQGVDAKGRGLVYNSVLDCAKKIGREEGILGFFKGWTANYFRIGPHTLCLLIFWDSLKHYHKLYEESNKKPFSL